MSQVYYIGSKKYLGSSSLAESACPYKEDQVFEAGDILLTPTEYWPHICEAVVTAKSQGVTTILMSDGILEWRNSFEQAPSDVESVGSPIWKPIHADYFLAMGQEQKRIVETWGNTGKCFTIGAPRLEDEVSRYAGREWKQLYKVTRKVLVASARKFAIGITDSAETLQAYRDLVQFFSEEHRDLPVHYEPVWRVSEQLAAELGLTKKQIDSGQGDLSRVIDGVDVVITGPSTLMLEAMLIRKPVVCLDYTSSPHFVRAAWNIRSKQHILPTFFSLLNIESHRREFQEYELKQQLRLDGSASKRLDDFVAQVKLGEKANVAELELSSDGDLNVSHKDALIAQLRFLIRRERQASGDRIAGLQKQIAQMRRRSILSFLRRLRHLVTLRAKL